MFIKQMVIEGACGDVEIRHTDSGALVIANDVEIEIGRGDSREEFHALAYNAAKVVYGTDRRDRPKATNSMIIDVLAEIERVTGC